MLWLQALRAKFEGRAACLIKWILMPSFRGASQCGRVSQREGKV